MTSTSRTNRIAQLLTLMALLLLAGCNLAPIKSVPSDNVETCTRRLADFNDNSPLSPTCQGAAEAYSYYYIKEHPELLLPHDTHPVIQQPKVKP
jgi:hypothetical protein